MTKFISSTSTIIFLSLLASSLLLPSVQCQARQMRQPGAKGHAVVESVIKVLSDSCLYRDDAGFLRRLAYVESNDGLDLMTYRQGYDGGIWQVDKDKFELTKTQASKLTNEYTILGSKLGIDWSTVTWSDLLKPLYSGIAAALYSKLQSQSSPLPSDVTGQAKFWQTNIRPGKTTQDFTDVVTTREQNCETADVMDILFVVDTSKNMTDAEWTQVKDYVKAKVIQLSQEKGLGDGGHRVAMITYSTGALLAFLFEGATDLQSVLAQIDLAPRLGFSANLTSAFSMAESLVFPRSRPQATKVMVVLTHNPSQQGNTGAVANAVGLKSQGVVIRMVGIGSAVKQAGLDTIASTPECSYSSRLQSYSDLGFDNFRYSPRICRDPVQLLPGVYTFPCDHNVLGKLPGDDKEYTLTVSVSNGEADFLASYSHPVPSMASNERFSRLTSSSAQPIVFHTVSNDTRTLSVKVNTDRPGQECNGKLTDTLFLFDSSIASDPGAFQRLVNFSIEYLSQFQIGVKANRAGVATFDLNTHNLVWLKDSTSLPQILTSLRQLTLHAPPLLHPTPPLRYHQPSNGPERSACPSSMEPGLIPAQLAQTEGMRVIFVAIDKTFDDPALNSITSSPPRVLKVTDINLMNQNLQALTNATCGNVSLKCVEQGVTRDCSPGDLVNSQYGQLVVGDRDLTVNPCLLPPIPGLPDIKRFPHPTKKDRFLICDRKHQAYVVLCPVGQIYDPHLKECETTPTTVAPPLTTTANQPLVVMASTTTRSTTQSTSQSTTTPTTTATPTSQLIRDKCTYTNILVGYRLHEYPGNRNLYINCSLTQGQGQIIACPQGKWWVQSSQKCAYICPIVDITKAQVDCSIHNPCDGPLLYYPHTTDPHKYLRCNPRKEALVMECPPYQVYKTQLASCDLP